MFIAYAFSSNRKKISYKTVVYGLLTQLVIAGMMIKTPLRNVVYSAANTCFEKLLEYSNQGAKFLFGTLVDSPKIGAIIAFQAMPIIVFVSAIMGVLVYFGVIQFIVKNLARFFYRVLKITGVEAFISTLLIFMGIESITGVKKYIENMNESRLFTIMTTFMSTIAGSVMLIYKGFGAEAGHLLTASIISVPAAILISKIMVPDLDTEEKNPLDTIQIKKEEKTVIEAVANGTSQGLNLALHVGAMLLAFVAIIYMINNIIGYSGVTMQQIFGYILSPFAILLGIPSQEAIEVGKLLGTKVVFSEFLAYKDLQVHIINGSLSARTIAISTYALCGFANFGSIAILIGGIGTLVPSQKPIVSRLALKSLVAGFLATMMTAAIASLMLI
jgi:CNT family concentrative nucleoside transporter